MAKGVEIQNSFTNGEIGVKIQGRDNLDEYRNSVSYLSNFIPLNSGGITYRGGFRDFVSTQMEKPRIIPFVFSKEEVYFILLDFRRGVPSDQIIEVYDNLGNSQPVFFRDSHVIDQLRQYDLEGSGFQYAQNADILNLVHNTGLIPPTLIFRTFNSELDRFEFNVGFINDVTLDSLLPSYFAVLSTAYKAESDFTAVVAGGIITEVKNTILTYGDVVTNFFGPALAQTAEDLLSITIDQIGTGSTTYNYQRYIQETDQPNVWQSTDIVGQATEVLYHNSTINTIELFDLRLGLGPNDEAETFFPDTGIIEPNPTVAYTEVLPLVSLFLYEENHTNLDTGTIYDPLSLKSGWYIRLNTQKSLTEFGIKKLKVREKATPTNILLELDLADFKREPFSTYLFNESVQNSMSGYQFDDEQSPFDSREFDLLGYLQYRNPSTTPINFVGEIEVVFETDTPIGSNLTKAVFQQVETKQSYTKMYVDRNLPDNGNIRVEVEKDITGAFADGEYEVWVSQWNPVSGYPKTITQWQERLIFGGSIANPDTIWNSQTFDRYYLHFFEFASTPSDAGFPKVNVPLSDNSAFSFVPSSNELQIITWLSAQDVLAIGTVGAEFTTQKASSIYGPNNKVVNRQSGVGGESIQAIIADNSIYFVGRNGKRLYEFNYIDANQQYKSLEISILNPNIVESGAKQQGLERSSITFDQIIWQDSTKVIWALNSIGRLVGCTLDVQNEVTGWFRVELGSFAEYKINSIALIPNLNNTSDDLLISISRRKSNEKDVNTQFESYVEILPIRYDKEAIEFTKTNLFFDQEACFLDSAVKIILQPTIELEISQGGPLEEMEEVNGN